MRLFHADPFWTSLFSCALYQALAYIIGLFQTDGAGFFLVGFFVAFREDRRFIFRVIVELQRIVGLKGLRRNAEDTVGEVFLGGDVLRQVELFCLFFRDVHGVDKG